MTMKINLNDNCRVKLTEAGIKQWIEWHKELRLPPKAQAYFETPRLDPSGLHQTQLWCLMQIFGPAIHIGIGDVFFEDNEILVDAE